MQSCNGRGFISKFTKTGKPSSEFISYVLHNTRQIYFLFQVQITLAATEGKNILQQYSQQSKALVSQVLHGSVFKRIKENLHDIWIICVTLAQEFQKNAAQFQKLVYESFIKTLGKQCKYNYI